ncbi:MULTISPECIES: hypothetical protein [unclassified Streptomyces]|uniref:hypothetical protein n=1 Tax=unclassified Streptomyces TaxID=2593676 RepID=UPI00278C53B2|nr:MULTISPECIES: hypothetical protein [unclassified Streptomyces]
MTSGHAITRDLAQAVRRSAQRTGERAPSVRGADWRTATVSAVTTKTVTADGIVCRRFKGDTTPVIGDQVVISQSGNGNWITLGPLA